MPHNQEMLLNAACLYVTEKSEVPTWKAGYIYNLSHYTTE